MAFSCCESLTEINLPENITEINQGAFYDCFSLKKINLPNNITEIKEHLFDNCESLQSINIPNSVTKIDRRAFENCKSLKKIKLPENLTEIGMDAFLYCESLQSITIPDSVIEIGENAFCWCISLENVVLNNPNIIINYDAFEKCESLNQKTKEKLIYQIAKNIDKNDIDDFFIMYDIKYDSEFIQELMTINISFFDIAYQLDKEVFIDAALDSINHIEETKDNIYIKTDICDILRIDNNYYLLLEKDKNNLANVIYESMKDKIDDAVKIYRKKEELDR